MDKPNMPKGVYVRKNKLTDEEKKIRRREARVKYESTHKERIAEQQRAYITKNKDRISRREKSYKENHADDINKWRKTYRDRKRDVIKEQRQRHYKIHRDSILDKQKEYHDKNREARNERSRRYYFNRKHTDAFKSAIALYYKTHPDVWRRSGRKRRALKRMSQIGDIHEISAWESNWRSKPSVLCYWCNKRVNPKHTHVDHVIPLSKGGSHAIDNLCISCIPCNLKKSTKLPTVWNRTLRQPLLFL